MRFCIVGLLLILIGCQNNDFTSSAGNDRSAPVDESVSDAKLGKKFLISDAIQLKINRYESIVKKYSKRYGFDWRLIMALIRQESRFNERARSRVGAKGLMQIMPGTASELTSELDIEYIHQNPRENIAAGIYHLYKQFKKLSYMHDNLERTKFALAAYNSGMGRVRDSRQIAIYKFNDDQHWKVLKQCLPLLTSKDWRLHLQVWEGGKPEYGYFRGSSETVSYVDNIMKYYRANLKFY